MTELSLDDIKKWSVFEANADVFNTVRRKFKEEGMIVKRNKIDVNSDYYEGRDVEHITIDNIPMYYKKIPNKGDGFKFHLDMIKGKMPMLYDYLFKTFGQTSGPEFYDIMGVVNWFNKHQLHLHNNKKLKHISNMGTLENLQSFKDFNK